MSPKESKEKKSKVFDGTQRSFNAWFRRVSTNITGKGLGDYLDESNKLADVDQSNKEALSTWKAENVKATSLLLDCLSDNLVNELPVSLTARQIVERLKADYETND